MARSEEPQGSTYVYINNKEDYCFRIYHYSFSYLYKLILRLTTRNWQISFKKVSNSLDTKNESYLKSIIFQSSLLKVKMID